MAMSSYISNVEISVYSTEKDPIYQESQNYPEDFKQTTQLMKLQELKLCLLFNCNDHAEVYNIATSNNINS